ncbi:MAG: endonuclease/exonuclease/phosphatase family protein [Planctomycetaceae bacterium]|nr:endonuclease/exonuclease/phosphatase family protein [Planctomycetaceae bacterium]
MITAAFCLQTVCSGEEPRKEGNKKLEFRVATYNIRYLAPADEETGNGWDVRKEPIKTLILSHDFDIVGTQEGYITQLSDLESLLPGYAYVGAPYAGKNGILHNNAIFYKTEKFEALFGGQFWLSETPEKPSFSWDATDRRMCVWTKFREKASGIEFYFFDTHFYYRYTIARRESGKIIVRKIREIAGESPVICVGDFNSKSDSEQIGDIKTLLSDSFQVTKTPPTGPENTAFPGGVFEGQPGSRIDYIFVSKQFTVQDYAVLPDTRSDGKYPSDHLPVTARLSIDLP